MDEEQTRAGIAAFDEMDPLTVDLQIAVAAPGQQGKTRFVSSDHAAILGWHAADACGIVPPMTDLTSLRDWVDRYRAAWRSNDPADIAALFTEDAVYRWNPFGRDQDGAIGRDAVVASWLDTPDDPDTWEMTCTPLAVNGDLGVVRCTVSYSAAAVHRDAAETWHNIWLVHLTPDGRCSDFTEHYMKAPA